MRDVLGPETWLGYCTNVHAGASWADTKANLETHALAVKRIVSPDEPMGIGLWLSSDAAMEIAGGGPNVGHSEAHAGEVALRDWLDQRGLVAFTMNGFPYSDFHADRVKHDVYRPTWADITRAQYTGCLGSIVSAQTHEGSYGSISTLPIGWPSDLDDDAMQRASMYLAAIVRGMVGLEEVLGRQVMILLEPEPGCMLSTSDDVVRFFSEHLAVIPDDIRRRYLGVCHDVCHAAVMGEDQRDVLQKYADAGITVGKIQISSALTAHVDSTDARAGLRAFAENRYLHQTRITSTEGTAFFDDLPDAIDAGPDGDWRIHFHVPIHMANCGQYGTTQQAVLDVLDCLPDFPAIKHFEVETYAWPVLPAAHQPTTLAEGIAAEMRWLIDRADERGLR
ncbi:MAG: metabolite traffic protein EboE [Planctomycetota bacterium]